MEPEPKKLKTSPHQSSSDSENSSSETPDEKKNRMSVNARTVFIQQYGANGQPDAVVYMDSESSKGDDLSQCSQDSIADSSYISQLLSPLQKPPPPPAYNFVPPLPTEEPESFKPEPPSEPSPGPSIRGLKPERTTPEAYFESESDVDDNELHKMLDEGLENRDTEEADPGYKIYKKTICKRYTKDVYSVLPQGWICINHKSGVPLYLHRPTRVCTWSRPYCLGAGSVRSHEVPQTAIPCLHYARSKEKFQSLNEALRTESNESAKLPQGIEPTEAPNDTEVSSKSTVDSLQATADSSESSTKPSENTEESHEAIAGASNETESHTEVAGCPMQSEASTSDAAPKILGQMKKVKIERIADCQVALSIDDMKEYARKLFDIEEISVRKFSSWSARRDYRRECRQKSRIMIPSSSHLVTCEMPNGPKTQRKEFMLNTSGKSAVGLLHEFVQHSMRDQPKYVFTERFSSDTPYCATIIIADIEYGVGYGSSKRLAKTDAAKKALSILMPSWNSMDGSENEGAKESGEVSQKTQEALEFFDDIAIEDPRLLSLCNAAGQMQPLHILMQCLRRNFGLSSGSDIKQKIKKESEKTQNICYEMTVGRHTVEVIAKNKREGKQLAAQQLLAKLHPYIKTWGNVLRLYGTHTTKSMKVKRSEQLEITELQTKVSSNAPNFYILSKLRKEMLKLRKDQDLDSAELPESHVKMLHI